MHTQTNANEQERMIETQTFEKERGNEDSHPMKECYKWALDHCMQVPEDDDDDSDEEASGDKEPVVTPMLVICQQYGDTNPNTPVFRRYKACTLPSFLSFYTAARLTDAERHCEEVIGLGPCKAYCDFETEEDVPRDALERSAQALIGEIVAYHKEKHGVDVRPSVHMASKPEKWSMHVTFVGSVWRSAAHFHACLKELVARRAAAGDDLVRLYVDLGVYGRFRCMRMPRSSKLKEPARSLLRADETAASPVDVLALVDTLITVFRLEAPRAEGGAAAAADDDDGGQMYVTTAFLDRYPDMIAKLGLVPIEWPNLRTSRLFATSTDNWYAERDAGDGAEYSPADAEFKTAFRLHFAHYKPHTYRWREAEGMLRVECNSHDCVIMRGKHEHNHVYLDVNVLGALWRHGCYSERCRREKTEWRELPEDVAALCRAYRARWRYATQLTALRSLVRRE